MRVVVGHGQRGVDEQFRNADAAEFLEDGQAAEFDERLFAVVEGGFDSALIRGSVEVAVLVEVVQSGVGRGHESDRADGQLRRRALAAVRVQGISGHRLDVTWNGGIRGPSETAAVVEVELVLEHHPLLLDEDLLAHAHGVDEALRDRFRRVGGIILGLVGRWASAIVESQALFQREDEIDEIGVGRDHGVEVGAGADRLGFADYV